MLEDEQQRAASAYDTRLYAVWPQAAAREVRGSLYLPRAFTAV